MSQLTYQNLPSKNCSNVFVGQSPKAREIKAKNKQTNKWNLIKLVSFYSRGNHKQNKMKRQPTDWEKISANDATNKGLISKKNKHLLQFNNKNKQTTQAKNVQQT